MKIKAVLFDLDGTLLPLDQDVFIKTYFGMMAQKLSQYGYDPDKMIKTIWGGTAAMIANKSDMTNEDVLWEHFTSVYGKESISVKAIFEDFYRNEFQSVKKVSSPDPRAAEVIAMLKERGIRVILATNPLFPSIATESRIRWAGLSPDDFELYTTYENYTRCKPNLDYYREILGKTGLSAEECVMVGNDVEEDMIARELGMEVFLLTDCLISRKNTDISEYPNGGFDELISFLRNITENSED